MNTCTTTNSLIPGVKALTLLRILKDHSQTSTIWLLKLSAETMGCTSSRSLPEATTVEPSKAPSPGLISDTKKLHVDVWPTSSSPERRCTSSSSLPSIQHSPSCDATADRSYDSDSTPPFIYTGQPPEDIPRDITHVCIDESVKVIHKKAFQNCEQLMEVELREGLEVIDEYAFSNCIQLKQIGKIPSTVKVIGSWSFHNCRELVSIDLCDGLQEIHEHAFFNCKSLQELSIPKTVNSIGDFACQNCIQLKSVHLHEGLKQIGGHCFYHCKSLREISIPSSIKDLRWTFAHCINLSKVDLHDGLEEVGYGTFYHCKSLQKVVLPSTVKSIGDDCFHDCNQLIEVTLPEGLIQIGYGAFVMCNSLSKITFPSSLKMIGTEKFRDYKQLAQLGLFEPSSKDHVILPPDFSLNKHFKTIEDEWEGGTAEVHDEPFVVRHSRRTKPRLSARPRVKEGVEIQWTQ